MKHRLHHVALPAPEFAFAGHDAVTEQDLDAVEADALGVVAVVGDQHAFHIVRVIDHIDIAFACRRIHAIGVAKARKKLDHLRQRFIIAAKVKALFGFWGCGLQRELSWPGAMTENYRLILAYEALEPGADASARGRFLAFRALADMTGRSFSAADVLRGSHGRPYIRTHPASASRIVRVWWSRLWPGTARWAGCRARPTTHRPRAAQDL